MEIDQNDTTEHTTRGPKDGPVKKIRYDGDQDVVETNLGKFVPGQVAAVHDTDAAQEAALTLIHNGQFSDPGDDAEVGVSEAAGKANAERVEKREKERNEALKRPAVIATPAQVAAAAALPRTPAQIQADAQAQIEADKAAAKAKK